MTSSSDRIFSASSSQISTSFNKGNVNTHLEDKMSASVAVYRNIYTEDRFRQSYGTEDKPRGGGQRFREKIAERCRCSRAACLHLLRERVPIFNWLPKYRLKKWMLGDTIAGLTVGILHIPQGEYIFKLILWAKVYCSKLMSMYHLYKLFCYNFSPILWWRLISHVSLFWQ